MLSLSRVISVRAVALGEAGQDKRQARSPAGHEQAGDRGEDEDHRRHRQGEQRGVQRAVAAAFLQVDVLIEESG